MKIKAGIVEDNQNLLRSMLNGLQEYQDIEVVMIAENGREAINSLQVTADENLPRLILMDIEMPEMNGIDATREITQKYGDIKIIMLTVFDQDDKIFDAILAGASGYMLKDEPMEMIVKGIKDILTGGAAMSSSIATKTLNLLRTGGPRLNSPAEMGLTKREIEILELFANGLTHIQIADKIFLSPSTIRKHIENIYEKLHVHSKVEAIQLVTKKNWFGSLRGR